MNIQRVTSDDWSLLHYLLKYAMECESAGSLKIDADAARALGLHGCSDIELKAVSAYCLSKPVSPCEAAMSLLEFPLIASEISFPRDSVPKCPDHVLRYRVSMDS
jgi:hypothetical protein